MKLLVSLFIFFLFQVAQAEPIFKIEKSEDDIIEEYLELHRAFFKQMCPFGTDHKYFKLLRTYQGKGSYLPEYQGDVDVSAIKKNLPVLKDKISWIKSMKTYLGKKKALPHFKKIVKQLQDKEDKLLIIKKRYQLAQTEKERNTALNESKKIIPEFKKEFNDFIAQIPFLLSYRYPVDHFLNRKEYDKYKDLGEKYKKIANEIFFLRKILEDGAQDPDHSRSDSFLRSTIDTVSLAIESQRDFISENVRYDLEYVYIAVENILKRGYKQQQRRLDEWLERTENSYNYYKDILKQSQEASNAKGLSKTQFMMKQKTEATEVLKEFVLEREADSYEFWKNQSELMKALFAIETILFNEVGDVDGREAIEREDVTQVVINRYHIPFYQRIDQKEDIYQYLKKRMSDAEIQKEHWLNVLFKSGEFSFTYFYISGVVHIFCPDQSRRGQFLRKENLRLAIANLKNPKENFKATRYFSRASMRGRIDMSRIWSGYAAMPERAGPPVIHQGEWLNKYEKGRYQYLYSFVDPQGGQYQVLKFDDEYLSVGLNQENPTFYLYRNPHLFTYFIRQ